ncbi:MAG: hypothetical protein AVDCRST_MAG70-1719, partial [uncultured Thermomicrobiales bacterium]
RDHPALCRCRDRLRADLRSPRGVRPRSDGAVRRRGDPGPGRI